MKSMRLGSRVEASTRLFTCWGGLRARDWRDPAVDQPGTAGRKEPGAAAWLGPPA